MYCDVRHERMTVGHRQCRHSFTPRNKKKSIIYLFLLFFFPHRPKFSKSRSVSNPHNSSARSFCHPIAFVSAFTFRYSLKTNLMSFFCVAFFRRAVKNKAKPKSQLSLTRMDAIFSFRFGLNLNVYTRVRLCMRVSREFCVLINVFC